MYSDLIRRLNEYSAEHENHGGITADAADAIEELTATAESYKRSMEAWADEAADAIEKLSKLADAIPHVCECCIGCELEKDGEGCDHAFVLSPKRAMQYLIKPRWIPVRERLPEKEKKSYLCRTDDGYHCEVRWTDNKYGLWSGGEEWGWSIFDIPQYSKVTHWMPLPEPPQEADNG